MKKYSSSRVGQDITPAFSSALLERKFQVTALTEGCSMNEGKAASPILWEERHPAIPVQVECTQAGKRAMPDQRNLG